MGASLVIWTSSALLFVVWLQGVGGDIGTSLLHLTIVLIAVVLAQKFLARRRPID